MDLGPRTRSPESVHRGKSWARHFVTRRGDVSYSDVPKITVMGCVIHPAAHPTYHLNYLAIKIRRLEEGVGKRDIQTWHF